MRIAFIVDQFPNLSTTFILNQITGLIDRGETVNIFALSRSKEREAHPDVKKYHLDRLVHYFSVPESRIKRFFQALLLTISNFHKDPVKMLRAWNIVKYGGLPEILGFTHIFALAFFLKKEFDVIHCHFGPNGNLGAVLKQIGIKSKLIATFHGYDLRLGLKKGQKIYRRLFKWADCIIANSHYSHEILKNLGANEKKLVILPCGIDLNKYPFRWKSQPIESPKERIIVSVARLVEIKGLQYGIQAIHELQKRFKKVPFKYFIIGGGPLEPNLKELVNDLNLNNIVFFLGPLEQDKVNMNLQKAQIFLLPSLMEMLGVAPMEAQAAGLPVVATSVGALSEVVLDGKSGYLVPPKDVNAISERLEYLLQNPNIWPQMGREGRKHIEKNYNISTINNKLSDIYKNISQS
jgi:colanic acid/amylovoran biosynthesis glycosyltransferase